MGLPTWKSIVIKNIDDFFIIYRHENMSTYFWQSFTTLTHEKYVGIWHEQKDHSLLSSRLQRFRNTCQVGIRRVRSMWYSYDGRWRRRFLSLSWNTPASAVRGRSWKKTDEWSVIFAQTKGWLYCERTENFLMSATEIKYFLGNTERVRERLEV